MKPLIQARWRLWLARLARDADAYQVALQQIDALLETIIERQAEL